ncbi:MAG: DmsE family decaheme c-type cytochrome [Thermoanaerobaculia bacterium]
MRARRRLALGMGLVLLLSLEAGAVLGATTAAEMAPGYVGSETCADCHDDVVSAFELSAHGRANLEGWSAAESCETCHGPGEAHVEDGDPELITVFAELSPEAGADACMSCHDDASLAYWKGSAHQTADSTCTSCHSAHTPWTNDHALVNKNKTASCLECHKDMRKTMYQRSNHPLKHGQMSCDSCHSPHGSPLGGAVDAASVNDKCWECHAETRGPFLWEHAPVRENCLTCHDSHGSNQTKLLTVSAPRLCQSCHLFGHHQTVPGEPSQVWNVNRSCVNCHPRIHGSNHPSGVIFMR